MGIKGILFMALALLGVVVNFSAAKLSARFMVAELKIKIAALVTEFLAIALLMIFGK